MAQAPLRIRPHLTYRQLTTRFKQAAVNREQRSWQLIRLMAHPKQPLLLAAAAEAAGFKERWARQLVHRYNQQGPAGYYDYRRHNAGRAPLLTKHQQTALHRAVLEQEPPGGGLWSSVSVAAWIGEKTGQRPSDVTGWKYLRKLGFTLHVPRPQHIHAATAAERAVFKKSSTVRLPGSNVVFQTAW